MTTDDNRAMIQALVDERNAVLLRMDPDEINAWAADQGVTLSDNPIVWWASVHKARAYSLSLPIEARSESKQWLIEHGFRADGIEDVPDSMEDNA